MAEIVGERWRKTRSRARRLAAGRRPCAVEKASDAVVTVSSGSDGMGGGEDMIGTELPDTKVLGARVLPVLGRRL